MANVEQLNKFVELKQKTNADVRQLGQVVSAREEQVSTASQTVINLANFVVNQDQKEAFLLFIDGQGPLVEGAGNDFTFTNIVSNTSAQITLSAPLAAGLNIVALKIGTSIAAFPNPSSVQATLNNDVGTPKSLLTDGFQNFVSVPKIACPNTNILNRAMIPDLANDMKPRMGVERIIVHQQPVEVLNEFGPSGERVWRPVNELDLVRFVGSWVKGFSANWGNYISSTSTGTTEFLEVTFYGTGLNALTVPDSAQSWAVSVDGGGEVVTSFASQSSILGARLYAPNQVVQVASGLALGIHTVKIRKNTSSNIYFSGFEIINANSTSVITNQGIAYIDGNKKQLNAQNSFAFNSVITGTKGGRVLVYLDSDGAVQKSFQATNASTQTLASTDHSNEEIARTYHWREFGAGRADDFSSLATSGSNRAFTLEDGSTTLLCQNCRVYSGVDNIEVIGFATGPGDFITITFVGTGLDIVHGWTSDLAINSTSVSIDGATPVNLQANPRNSTVKIVSGLPYGTHTVKIAYVGAGGLVLSKFIVYQPKKPVLPAGAIELADYNVMATYVANATGGPDTVGTGLMRKGSTRELSYFGSWTLSLSVSNMNGWLMTTVTNADYLEYTFFGTGFDWRFATAALAANAATWQITVDGSTDLSAFTTSSYGAGISSFTAATGTVVSNTTNATCGISVSGLSVGAHKIRLTKISGTGAFSIKAIDVITPIHSQKSSFPASFYNALSIGNESISDNRILSPVGDLTEQKSYVQSLAITSSPTTTSTSMVPIPDMNAVISTKDGRLRISYSSVIQASSISFSFFLQVYVDGVPVGLLKQGNADTASGLTTMTDVLSIPVSAGTHKVEVYWRSDNAGMTITAYLLTRNLLVEEA